MKTDFRPDKATQAHERLRALLQLLTVTWRWLDIVRIERISTARESGWKVTYVPGSGAARRPDPEEPPLESEGDEQESRPDEGEESDEGERPRRRDRGRRRDRDEDGGRRGRRDRDEDAGAEPPARGEDDDDILGPPRRH